MDCGVILDQGEIVGFVVADIEEDGDAPYGMVYDVLVKEECRGCGAGEALLQTAIAWLRERGVSGIYLESGKNNHAAHRFFEKRGFTLFAPLAVLSARHRHVFAPKRAHARPHCIPRIAAIAKKYPSFYFPVIFVYSRRNCANYIGTIV